MKPVVQRGPDDCVRACICTLLGLEPEQLSAADKPAPEITPDRWWVEGSEALRRFGLALVETGAHYLVLSHLESVPWIALVPSLFQSGSHAVVMRGSHVVHDPARSEPRYDDERVADAARRNVLGAAVIVATDPALIVDLRGMRPKAAA